MSAWRTNRVFERDRARRDLAIAILFWLGLFALIAALIADVLH